MRVQTSHWTRSDVRKFRDNGNTRFPAFDPAKLGPLMPGFHVWDSWFIMTEDGKVAKFNGHKVLIALVRPIGSDDGEKIGVFVDTPNGYVSKGFMFKKPIWDDVREWSGSTILRNDGKVQCFYTISMGVEFDGVWQTVQRFATSIQSVSYDAAGLPELSEPLHHALLAEPDGVLYETARQSAAREAAYPSTHRMETGNDQTDNFCFRDPKFFKDPKSGKKFIIFEGNTGPGSGHVTGSMSQRYLGTDTLEGFRPTPDDLKANGCVGIFELTNKENTFGVFHKPWLTANLVTDEIERINLMFVNGLYYLFVAGHGNKNSMLSTLRTCDGEHLLANVDYMLGFVAQDLFGELAPLNRSGVVVHQRSLGARYAGQEQNQQYTYSWLLVPTDRADEFECVSYANFCKDGDSIKPTKTAGPSLTVRIDGTATTIVDMFYDIVPVKHPQSKGEKGTSTQEVKLPSGAVFTPKQ